MKLATDFVVGLVAVLHVGFLVLEMFLWQTRFGQKTFLMSPAKAADTAVLAKNQGLYNGFLAAGLAWGLVRGGPEGQAIQHFFLGCVVVAGVYGGITVKRSILFIQALPAAIGLVLLHL